MKLEGNANIYFSLRKLPRHATCQEIMVISREDRLNLLAINTLENTEIGPVLCYICS